MFSKNIAGGLVLRIALGTMVIVLLLLLQSVSYAGASTIQQINNGSSETGVTVIQKVPFSIESIAEVKVRESNQPAYVLKRRAIPFHKEPPPKELKPETAPLKPQSALQYEPTTSLLAPVLSGNFIGLSDTGWIPPDTMGAVGPSQLMEVINGGVGFFNKSTGALISNVSLQAFWSSFGTGSGQPDNFPFDPKVIYDQNSGRFIAVTDGGGSSPGSWLMIAVSATSDPTGTWFKWAIAADKDGGVQLFNNWADFPCFGVDANYVYITANMYDNSGSYQYYKVWVIPKTQLLNGNSSITWTEFRAPTGYSTYSTLQPAYVFGSSSTEYLINQGPYISGTPPRRFLSISSITFPGGTPTWTNLGYIEVSSYPTSSFPDAPQLGNSTLIDTGDARLLNAVYRNGYLWTTHTVTNTANTKTEVAWYQINPATASLSSPYGTPVQQGRISDVNRWYYYPSIAVNSNGDVGIGFSGSSTSEYAGAYYTARNSSDAAGTMQSVGLLKAGLASYYKTFNNRNRWGDYSATVIDPGDNTTFWTLQEYANTPSNTWGTWWGKFALTTVMPSLAISASQSTVTAGTPTNVTFTVTRTDNGSSVSSASVTLSGNATGSGITNISGIAVISVNATVAGIITATASAQGYTNGSTNITATTPMPTPTPTPTPTHALSSNPWPMFHGEPNHTGYAAVVGPQTADLKWKYFFGTSGGPNPFGPNSIAVSSDGTVYVGGYARIAALDENGSLIWSKNYTSTQGPALSENGTLYFDSGNSIIAMDSLGNQLWQFDTGNSTLFGPTVGPDGTIYQGSWDNYFYAINPNGTLKWKYKTQGAVSYPASIGSDGTIYLGGGDAHGGPDPNLYAFDVSGNLKWKFNTTQLRVGSPAVADDGTIYAAASPMLYALDSSGNSKWSLGSLSFPIAGIITPAVAPDGTIYIGSYTGILYAINSTTHGIKWTFQTGSDPNQPGFTGLPSWPLVDNQGTVYLGSVDNKMYAIDQNGNLKWSYQTGNRITEAAPAFDAHGNLYFSSDDGYVYKMGAPNITASTGKPLLVSSITPNSRNAQVGTPITIFMSVINGGNATATGVSITQASSLPVTVSYRQWNGTAFTGLPNTPVDIPAGGAANFVLSINATSAFSSSSLTFNVSSTNGAIASISGVNTLIISSSTVPSADVIMMSTSLAVSTAVNTPTVFAVATSNVGGANATNVSLILSVPASISGLSYKVNETYPMNGTVKGPATGLTINVGAQPTFAMFVTPTQPITFDPANNRITLQLVDGSGKVIGAQSVAVSTT